MKNTVFRGIILLSVLFLMFTLCSCGTSGTSAEKTDVSPSSDLTAEEKFSIAEKMTGGSYSELVKQIGESDDVVCSARCGAEGEDCQYSYSGFVVFTYKAGDSERIEYVEKTIEAAPDGNTGESTEAQDSAHAGSDDAVEAAANSDDPEETAESSGAGQPGASGASASAGVPARAEENNFGLVEGHLVYYTASGDLLKNGSVGTFSFDENGWYTAGDESLDVSVAVIVAGCTEESMTQAEKLRAVYDFMVTQCSYRAGEIHETGEEGWQLDAARAMISNEFFGNCYSYAGLFRELARAVGYPAEAYSGTVRGMDAPHTPHGWVEIAIDGTTYLYDSEMQFFNGLDMYGIELSTAVTQWGYEKEPRKDTE